MFNLISNSVRSVARNNVLRNQAVQFSRCLSNSVVTFSPKHYLDSRNSLNHSTPTLHQRCSGFHTSTSFWKQTVKVPPFADSVSEGDAKLIAKVGEQVKVDQVVMEIETDKTAVPVPAPCSGVITEILVNDGDTVKPGQDLFTIEPTA